MSALPKPTLKQKRFLLTFFLLWAIASWLGYFQDSGSAFSLLSNSSNLSGPFSAIGGFSFFFQLLFVAMLTYIYELGSGIRKVYSLFLAFTVLVLCYSYIFTGTLLGITRVDLYEPMFMTFLFLNALVFHLTSQSGTLGAIET